MSLKSLKFFIFVYLFEVTFSAVPVVYSNAKDNLISIEIKDELPRSLIRSCAWSCESKWNNEPSAAYVITDSLQEILTLPDITLTIKKTNHTVSRNSATVFSAPLNDIIDASSVVTVNHRTMNTEFEEGNTRHDNSSLSTNSDFNLNTSFPQFRKTTTLLHGDEAKVITNARGAWYCDERMDNVLEMLLENSGSTRVQSVIPAHFATRWFYYGAIDDSDVEYARSHFSDSFVAAVNVHSGNEHAASGEGRNHWIFFSRGSDGMLHVYDSFGNEERYKKILQSNFKKFWERLKRQSRCHNFDDNNCKNLKKKKHPIQ